MKTFNRAAMLRNASGLTVRAMVRKPILLRVAVVLLATSPLCRAQIQAASLSSTIELARAEMTSERNAIISGAMQLKDKDAAAFWPIYRKYEYERSIVDDGKATLVKEYAEKYSSLSDADAKSMTERMLAYDARESTLKRKYFKEFSKVLPGITVAAFFQLDHRVDILMAVKVESSLLPLGAPKNTEQPAAAQPTADSHDVK